MDSPEITLAETENFKTSERSFDYLKNEIKAPESKEAVEKLHESIVNLVNEINKPDNLDGFIKSRDEFFTNLGIEPTDDETLSKNNKNTAEQAYLEAKLDDKRVDVQIHGKGGIYANIYLDRSLLPGGKRITQVSPDACSIPNPIRKPEGGQTRINDKNFYKIMEDNVGIDPDTKQVEMYKNHPYMQNDPKKYKYFYVVDGRKMQVSANNPLVRFAKRTGIV